MSKIQLVEWDPQYEKQVIVVVTQVLKHQQVVPAEVELVDDEDLFRIPETYQGRSLFWVCIEDRQVIGTVAIREMSASTARLNRMFVLPAYHGQGIGQQLLEHALGFAQDQGYRKVILNTHVLMQRAHRFYERNGFVRVAEDVEAYHYRRNL